MRSLIYFLGSSVTYGYATGGVSFVEELEKISSFRCVKEAVNGTTLARTGDGLSYCERLKNFPAGEKPSVLAVQLSTNDATKNVPLGRVEAEREHFDMGTVCGAMEYLVRQARRMFGCGVVFYTNPFFENARYKEMVSALYEIKEKWGIGVIDFYRAVGAGNAGIQGGDMADEIHPNASGYRKMARAMYEYLK